MKNRQRSSKQGSRRGVTAVLVALLIVFIVGMVAFGVDVGYIVLVRTQLQAAADSAAMAAIPAMISDPTTVYSVANTYAAKHWTAGKNLSLATADVQIGVWDSDSKTFTASSGSQTGNAVKVTAHRDAVPLFFGTVFRQSFDASASAIAMSNPRDICFVVDLSGSMNDDTETCWVSDYLDSYYAGQGYGNVGATLMQNVYTDFGFGTYPGTLEYWGSTLGVTSDSNAYANMTKNSGPLTTTSIAVAYRITSTDTESQRKKKCYSWIMDQRLKTIMPNAIPAIDSTSSSSYNYWERYLDFIVKQSSPSGRGTIPALVSSSYNVSGLGNPQNSSYDTISSSTPDAFYNKYGYRTYVQFMMDFGRDIQAGGRYTPLSYNSSDCPMHTETVGSDSFSFPPREQPTHASRRSMIAAMQVVDDQNKDIPSASVRDWVSIVTFDHLSSGGPVVAQALTGDYDAAMQACTKFQAVGDDKSSTATETGLMTAHSHLKSNGRKNTTKVVVLLTDGVPNLYSSSNSTISSYISAHPSSNYYSGSSYASNAPLMQAATMQGEGYYMYSVGLGLGSDYTFLDKLARMGNTADDNGETFRGSGNPTDYETVLKDIFEKIIKSPKTRLVQ